MTFNFRDLNEDTRRFMVDEIEAAIREGNLYFSRRFNQAGYEEWPALLLEAAKEHNGHWLAYQLESRGTIKGLEGSWTPSGGYTIKHVPHTAAETMAEGQFNRYYILGLCRRALAEGKAQVFVYRAKEVRKPRPESNQIIGQSRDPSELIEQIRPVKSSLGHELLQPNSGLSIHL
jgi:hypothetical protein